MTCESCQQHTPGHPPACPVCGGLERAVPVLRAGAGGGTPGRHPPPPIALAATAPTQWRLGWFGVRLEGHIVAPPLVVDHRGGLGRLALMLILLLSLPVLLIALMPLLVVLWLTGRVLGPLAFLLPLAGGLRRGRAGGDDRSSVYSFRIAPDHAPGVREVRLRGHRLGLAHGDAVVVDGFTHRGVVHAWRVRNMTTGQTLTSPQMLAAGVVAVVAVLLGLAAL